MAPGRRSRICLVTLVVVVAAGGVTAERSAAGTVTLDAGVLRYQALAGESKQVRIVLESAGQSNDVVVSEFAAAAPRLPGVIERPGTGSAVAEQPGAGVGCSVGTAKAERWMNYSELPVVRCAIAQGAPLPRLHAELGSAEFTYLIAARRLRGEVFGSPGADDINAGGR